jgi:hypothetical protein
MPFSAYDSDALRVLSAALSGALDSVRKSKGRELTETETSNLSKKLAANLMAAFDDGNREPAALKRAALDGKYVSLGTSMGDV